MNKSKKILTIDPSGTKKTAWTPERRKEFGERMAKAKKAKQKDLNQEIKEFTDKFDPKKQPIDKKFVEVVKNVGKSKNIKSANTVKQCNKCLVKIVGNDYFRKEDDNNFILCPKCAGKDIKEVEKDNRKFLDRVMNMRTFN